MCVCVYYNFVVVPVVRVETRISMYLCILCVFILHCCISARRPFTQLPWTRQLVIVVIVIIIIIPQQLDFGRRV